MKLNYVIIPLVVVITSLIGGSFTSRGMEWYATIKLPSWTPPGSVIGTVWTVIYLLTMVSALITWNRIPKDSIFYAVALTFIINAILNAGWSLVFFRMHKIGLAVSVAALLELSVLVLIFLLWNKSKLASALLFPYAGWVIFATYLNTVIWRMNL
jgi:benzodiazapine receptor